MNEPVRARGRIPACDVDERERELVSTAQALFLESGYDGVSVESIARAAHVSPKTIYARFGGKDGLFVAAMKPHAEELVAHLDGTPADARDAERMLARFGEVLLALTLSSHAVRVQRRLIGEAARFPALTQRFYANGPAVGLAALADFFERCRRAKLFACSHPRNTAEYYLGALQGEWLRVALLFDERPGPSDRRARSRDVARTIVAALIHGTSSRSR